MYVNTIYKEIVSYNLIKKYSDDKLFERDSNPYVSMLIDNLIENKNTQYCARYRDWMIYDYIDEFLKRFYLREESIARLPGMAKYYKTYLKFMCKPTLRNFRANDILHLYADQKADLYQCINYENKNGSGEKNKEKIKFQTILTETVKEKINENVITRSEVDCEDLLFNTESITKDNNSLNLDEHSLALLGLNEHIVSYRSNKEESLIFLLGKFEDRKLNVGRKNSLLNDNKQKVSNYEGITRDNSDKTVKEQSSNEVKIEERKGDGENLVNKEINNDLKMKLKNIIQDINTKTRNRNNHIAAVSLSKDNSKTNTLNKINVVPNSLARNKLSENNKKLENNSNKLKSSTLQSKNVSNTFEFIENLKKNSEKVLKRLKLKNLDFKMINSKEAKVSFKSNNDNSKINYDINSNIKKESNIHKTQNLKYIQSQVRSENTKYIPTGNKKITCLPIKKFINKTNEKNTGDNNIKQNTKKAQSNESKLLDNYYIFSTRIQLLDENQNKSRNTASILNHEKDLLKIKNEPQTISNTVTKSYKINLNYPSNYKDLRNKIYASFDNNKFLNNFISVTTSKISNRQLKSKENKSPINNSKIQPPGIFQKNKLHHNINVNNKKADSTCDKSNQLTYNSVKTKEIFSTICFQKNSGEKILNTNSKKEKVSSPCLNKNDIPSSAKEYSTSNINNKMKVNLINAFNTCSKNSKQQKIITSSKNIKFNIEKYERLKQNK